MSDVLLAAFALRRQPFAKDVSTDTLWLDEARKTAVERLIAAVSRREHVLVKGDSGSGKNCVLRAMRDALSPVHFRPVYLANVTLGRRDFYRQVSLALGLEPRGTPAALFEAIQRDIETLHREHRVHPVLVLDEAQLMPDTTLSHLHVLMNFAWDSEPRLSLVLVGLPELHERLKLGIHRSCSLGSAPVWRSRPCSPIRPPPTSASGSPTRAPRASCSHPTRSSSCTS